MNFLDMDPTGRALTFGAFFLFALAVELWAFYDYDSRGRPSNGLLFILLGGVAVLATLPALGSSAFTLDVNNQDIVNPLGTVGMAGAGGAVFVAILYLAFGRPPVADFDFESTIMEQTEPPAEPVEPTNRAPSPEPTRIDRDPEDDKTRIRRKKPERLAYLVIRSGARAGRIIQLDEEMSIGRANENDIVLDDDDVSRRHARVRLRDGGWVFADLDSANGSFLVHGERAQIEAPHSLAEGDQIELGSFVLQFTEISSPPASESAE